MLGLAVAGCTTGEEAEDVTTTTRAVTTSAATTAAGAETTRGETADEPIEEHRHAYWSYRRALTVLGRARITVERRRVPLDRSTLTCGGEGRAVVRNGVATWAHFRCIQPTFPAGQLVGPDAIFHVHVTGRRAFVISGAQLTEE